MKIDSFTDFLITEKLHINKEIDDLSNRIYDIVRSDDSKDEFIIKDIPEKLDFSEVVIKFPKKMAANLGGSLDVNKCHKGRDGKWKIYIILRKHRHFLDSLKHELQHAFRLTKMSRQEMSRKLNYLKSGPFFKSMTSGSDLAEGIDDFFFVIYLASDEEIVASVAEAHGNITELMNRIGLDKLSKQDFTDIIKYTNSYHKSKKLIDFKIKDYFKNFDKNKINKFFSLLEDNKAELDSIVRKSRFWKWKLFLKVLRDTKKIVNKKISFDDSDTKIYHPKRGPVYYERWINSQGEKFRKRLFDLYDHYNK